MKTITLLSLSCLFILLTAFTCDEQDSLSCEERISKLNAMQSTIQNFAETSVCNDNFECRSIPFGSKPCGGPWSYLVYSTSIDTLKLTNLVDTYNQLEKILNSECGRTSDCAFVNPPQQLQCKNNNCIATY